MVSLLYNQPPHTVTVVLRREVKDRRGKMVPEEVGRVLCRGFLQESSSSDVERYAGTGVAVADLRRFITMEGFPGDANSLVVADGVIYEVVGAPKRHRNSRATAHDAVTLSAQSQEGVWT